MFDTVLRSLEGKRNVNFLLTATVFNDCPEGNIAIYNYCTWCLIKLSLSLSLSHAVLHDYQLCQGEQGVSLTSCILGESAETKNTFYVVGTAFVDIGEREPTQGRVLVF